MIPCSAVTKQGIIDIIDHVILMADIEGVTANPGRPAIATVIESHLDKSKGPLLTLIVNTGTLHVGDIIGSGTVGTGCFLELNGTGKRNDPGYEEQWLKEGDTVEMEVDGLGKLSNTIVKEESDFSILALKKSV